MINGIQVINVNVSAIGCAICTPRTPKALGRIIINGRKYIPCRIEDSNDACQDFPMD